MQHCRCRVLKILDSKLKLMIMTDNFRFLSYLEYFLSWPRPYVSIHLTENWWTPNVFYPPDEHEQLFVEDNFYSKSSFTT